VRIGRIALAALAGLALSGVLACSPAPAVRATLTDSWGRAIALEKPPERIVSHVPGITEALFALGLGDKVVGVSQYCDYPPEARAKPKVGSYNQPDLETIISMKPDLVLTNGYATGLVSRLESGDIAGKKLVVVVRQPKSIEEVLANLELLGKVTGTEARARELVQELRGRISAVTSKVQQAQSKPRLYYEVQGSDYPKLWTAGPGSYVDEIITLAGGQNIAAGAATGYPQISSEQVLAADPEVITVADGKYGLNLSQVSERTGWGSVTAVKKGAIYLINSDLTQRDGPRLVDGLEEIAALLHPELGFKRQASP